jgi:hypothetical protein
MRCPPAARSTYPTGAPPEAAPAPPAACQGMRGRCRGRGRWTGTSQVQQWPQPWESGTASSEAEAVGVGVVRVAAGTFRMGTGSSGSRAGQGCVVALRPPPPRARWRGARRGGAESQRGEGSGRGVQPHWGLGERKSHTSGVGHRGLVGRESPARVAWAWDGRSDE